MSTLVDSEGSVLVYIYIQELTNTGMLKSMHMMFCEKCFCYGTVVITEWLPLQGTVNTKYSV